MVSPEREPLLTVREVAELLRVAQKTVRRWAVSEGLPSIRLGRVLRFEPGDVSRWLSARKE